MSISAKKLAAGQLRSLRSIRKKLLDMSYAWADIDEFNRVALSELADRIETMATEIIDEESIHEA